MKGDTSYEIAIYFPIGRLCYSTEEGDPETKKKLISRGTKTKIHLKTNLSDNNLPYFTNINIIPKKVRLGIKMDY